MDNISKKDWFPREIKGIFYSIYLKYYNKLSASLFKGDKVEDFLAKEVFQNKNKYISLRNKVSEIIAIIDNYEADKKDEYLKMAEASKKEAFAIMDEIKSLSSGTASEMVFLAIANDALQNGKRNSIEALKSRSGEKEMKLFVGLWSSMTYGKGFEGIKKEAVSLMFPVEQYKKMLLSASTTEEFLRVLLDMEANPKLQTAEEDEPIEPEDKAEETSDVEEENIPEEEIVHESPKNIDTIEEKLGFGKLFLQRFYNGSLGDKDDFAFYQMYQELKAKEPSDGRK